MKMTRDWSTTTRVVVVVVTILLAAVFLYAFRQMIKPLIVAGVLAYGLNLLVKPLRDKTELSHKAAVNLVYLFFLLVIIATPGTLIPLTVSQAEALSAEIRVLQENFQAFLVSPLIILGRTINLNEVLANFIAFNSEVFSPNPERALNVIETTSISLVWLLVIFVTTYYLLMDSGGLMTWLVNLAPESGRTDIRRLMTEIDNIWHAYIRGTLALMIIMAIVFIIVGLVIGLPGAVAIGLFTGLLSMVPEIGPLIAGILAVLVALVEGSTYLPIPNFWFAALVAGIYLVIMQIKSIWLRPHVMGRFMHMNTGLVFLAIIAAVVLEGILGALLVLPLMASVGIIGRYVRARMLNIEPWSPESAVLPPKPEPQPQLEPELEFLSEPAEQTPGEFPGD
jgi:predicted PurR-regulated permease PerM